MFVNTYDLYRKWSHCMPYPHSGSWTLCCNSLSPQVIKKEGDVKHKMECAMDWMFVSFPNSRWNSNPPL